MSYISVTIHKHTHASVCVKSSLQFSAQSTHICISLWLLHSTDCSSHQKQYKSVGLYFIAVPSMVTLLWRKLHVQRYLMRAVVIRAMIQEKMCILQ